MRLFSLFSLLVSLLMPLAGQAFTAVASVSGHAGETLYAAWNHPTQKEADALALKGCRLAAKETGIANLASKCVIVQRQKSAGGGAMVCGEDGCAYTTAYATQQGAVDAAYKICAQSYKNCQQTGITSWWDEAGYRKQLLKAVKGGGSCSPPTGRNVRSQTQCNNGDCLRTFENGCQVRFQAAYCHDPFSGRWEWKPDGC